MTWTEFLAFLSGHRNPYATVELFPKPSEVAAVLARHAPESGRGGAAGQGGVTRGGVTREATTGSLDAAGAAAANGGPRSSSSSSSLALAAGPHEARLFATGPVDDYGGANPSWGLRAEMPFEESAVLGLPVRFTAVLSLLLPRSFNQVGCFRAFSTGAGGTVRTSHHLDQPGRGLGRGAARLSCPPFAHLALFMFFFSQGSSGGSEPRYVVFMARQLPSPSGSRTATLIATAYDPRTARYGAYAPPGTAFEALPFLKLPPRAILGAAIFCSPWMTCRRLRRPRTTPTRWMPCWAPMEPWARPLGARGAAGL